MVNRTLYTAVGLLLIAGTAAHSAPGPAALTPDWRTPTDAAGTRAVSGAGMNYQRLEREDGSLQTFSLPIILPLEASLGRLSLGSSVEYVRKDFQSEAGNRSLEGPGYFSLDGRFRALESSRYRIDWLQSINVPLARERDNELPPEAWLNTGGYVVDSGFSVSYLMRRTRLSFDLQHSWRMAHRDYDPGESVRAALIFGFGFGNPTYSSLSYNWPVSITLGVTSHYNYADRLNQTLLEETERGALYVAPGINFARNSLNLWADVEIPFYQLHASETGFEERLRGRIGMRYFFE